MEKRLGFLPGRLGNTLVQEQEHIGPVDRYSSSGTWQSGQLSGPQLIAANDDNDDDRTVDKCIGRVRRMVARDCIVKWSAGEPVSR